MRQIMSNLITIVTPYNTTSWTLFQFQLRVANWYSLLFQGTAELNDGNEKDTPHRLETMVQKFTDTASSGKLTAVTMGSEL